MALAANLASIPETPAAPQWPVPIAWWQDLFAAGAAAKSPAPGALTAIDHGAVAVDPLGPEFSSPRRRAAPQKEAQPAPQSGCPRCRTIPSFLCTAALSLRGSRYLRTGACRKKAFMYSSVNR